MKPVFRQSGLEPAGSLFARRRIALASVSMIGIAMLSFPVSAGSAQFVWNPSTSAPTGLYRIERDGWRAGDRVAVLPSRILAADLDKRGILRGGKLLIKRVVAAEGDTVCRRDGEVTVNGDVVALARAAGSDGSPLPSWQDCVRLDSTEVFLLGDTADSYDGRYFGVTSAGSIVGRATIIVSFPR